MQTRGMIGVIVMLSGLCVTFVGCKKKDENELRHQLFLKFQKGECPSDKKFAKAFPGFVVSDVNGVPLLHHTAMVESPACLEKLIEEGARLDVVDQVGESALFAAARKNRPGAIEILHKKGLDITARNQKDQSAIIVAVQEDAWAAADKLTALGLLHPEAEEWLRQGVLNNNPELATRGLRLRASVYSRLEGNRNAIMLAAERGYLPVLQAIVRPGVDVNRSLIPDVTATSLAFSRGHLAVARFLISRGGYDPKANEMLFEAINQDNVAEIDQAASRGANLNGKNADGMPTLILAYGKNKKKAFQRLLDLKANLNQQDVNGNTVLMKASQQDKEDIVRQLIQLGADVNRANEFGYTALILAASEGHDDIVKLLLAARADVNHETLKGGSAVYWARERGHEKIVSLLIKAGAIDPDNFEALIHAIRKGDIKATKAALAAKVNINARNKDGYSAIMFAANQGSVDVLDLLVKSGADINIQEAEGYTPVMMAAWSNKPAAAERLLKAGCNTRMRHKTGRTALMLAAWKSSPELVKMLVKNSEINAQDNDGWTALMFAANDGNTEKIKILLAAGANKGLKNRNERTAKDIAVNKGHNEAARLL